MQSRRSFGLWLGKKLVEVSATGDLTYRRERYRDLLQASTSIIEISESSQKVLDAVMEMKQLILMENQLDSASDNVVTRSKDGE